MKVVIIDNYDSFTYNLAHLVKELGAEVTVFRNDQFQLRELDRFDKIILSPGPGIPSEAGLLMDVIKTYAGRKPMLGVCLGHQAIAQVFGARVVRAAQVMHGKTSPIGHQGQGLFAGLKQPLTVTRYHSLIVEADSLPAELEVTAWTLPDQPQQKPEIMGLRHRHLPIVGVQFHPESILSEQGMELLANFIAMSSAEKPITMG